MAAPAHAAERADRIDRPRRDRLLRAGARFRRCLRADVRWLRGALPVAARAHPLLVCAEAPSLLRRYGEPDGHARRRRFVAMAHEERADPCAIHHRRFATSRARAARPSECPTPGTPRFPSKPEGRPSWSSPSIGPRRAIRPGSTIADAQIRLGQEPELRRLFVDDAHVPLGGRLGVRLCRRRSRASQGWTGRSPGRCRRRSPSRRRLDRAAARPRACRSMPSRGGQPVSTSVSSRMRPPSASAISTIGPFFPAVETIASRFPSGEIDQAHALAIDDASAARRVATDDARVVRLSQIEKDLSVGRAIGIGVPGTGRQHRDEPAVGGPAFDHHSIPLRCSHDDVRTTASRRVDIVVGLPPVSCAVRPVDDDTRAESQADEREALGQEYRISDRVLSQATHRARLVRRDVRLHESRECVPGGDPRSTAAILRDEGRRHPEAPGTSVLESCRGSRCRKPPPRRSRRRSR